VAAATLPPVLHTKRWNDPASGEDGKRLLVTRYRPRGVAHDAETWDAWLPQLGPSRALHAAVYGKGQAPIGWEEYRERYLSEMQGQRFWIDALGQQHARGETLTLLCSSACVDPGRCHRTLLAELIAESGGPRVAPVAKDQRAFFRRAR
jgi:uncharacterized protein YeaO (DUF488 family)